MTTTTGSKAAGDRAAEPSTSSGAGVTDAERTGLRPVVYDVRKRKRRSRGLKEIQRQEESLSRAAQRAADAVADGFSEYRRRRIRSAERKLDGAMMDAVRNSGRGLEEAIRTAAAVPTDPDDATRGWRRSHLAARSRTLSSGAYFSTIGSRST